MPQEMFGFSAEYLGPSPAYDEFMNFLRVEFGPSHADWRPRFGKAVGYDPVTQDWNYMFLLTGSVPGARSRDVADRKARALVHQLGSRLRAAHANPGAALPDPVVRVWRWEPARPSLRVQSA